MKLSLRFLQLLVVLFVLSSCDYSDVKFKTIQNFKFGKLEGKTLSLSADVLLDNPNNYNIKIKPSDVDLYINDMSVGLVHLDEKVKIRKKGEAVAHVPITITLHDGILLKLLMLSQKKDGITLRVAGKVKGTVGFISKKIDIDQRKVINLKDFDLKGLDLKGLDLKGLGLPDLQIFQGNAE